MQECMKVAALEAAASERQESLDDGDQAMARCAQEGIPVVEWDDAEVARYKALTKPVYDYFETQFPAGLIDSIRTIQ
jgi:TRAP-type C4-dicarboxylate transport system substrate-binding protein